MQEGFREIPNPFVFGSPITETENNLFTGRQDIVRQLESVLLGSSTPPTLLLYGSRRVGKSSILRQLPRLLGPELASAFVDCQTPALTGSAATLFRYLSRAMADGLRRRRCAVEPLAASALEREPFAAFDEWLDGLELKMTSVSRILLCLDEYERLESTLESGWGYGFLDLMRHTIQHRSRVVVMFTGSHTFAEMGPEWTDRFISAVPASGIPVM